MPVVALAAIVACRASAPAPPALRRSETRVATNCVPAREVEVAIANVLAAHHAEQAGLLVDVGETSAENASVGVDIMLRVIRRDGDVGLDRHYALADNDCPSAPQLLALAIDRWLTSFPEWAEPPEPPAPPPARGFAAGASATASAIAPPLGVDGELAALVDYGGPADRFGVSAVFRSGVPQRAGGGRFLQIAMLGGATWRHRFARWETRAEVRAGGLRVSGIGFAEDHASWLPWFEIAAFVGRRWSRGAIGAEVAATALHDRAVTRDGLVSQDIPLARIGVSGTFEIF
jgi:hypothetical protein